MMMSSKKLTFGVVLLLPATATAGERPEVDVNCKPTKEKYVYHCMFDVTGKKSQEPIKAAIFRVNANMPTMPMAHNVKPIEPVPIPEKPGTYHGNLQLEMMGEWTLKMTFKKPVRDVVVRKLMFGEKAMKNEQAGQGEVKIKRSGHRSKITSE